MKNAILVLSRSARQAELVARMLRNSELRCMPLPIETPSGQALSLEPSGLILLSEGPAADALDGLDDSLLHAGLPVLALNGAAAALCARFGGSFRPLESDHSVTLGLHGAALFSGIDSGERMMTGIAELDLPEGFSPIATATERVIGFRQEGQPLYAMQYPLERNDPDSAQLLYNFAVSICGAKPLWTEDAIIDEAVERIRQAAPVGRVLCAVSGGVDSAVCARLTRMAVGERLLCVFVDTGLFRQDEPETVIRTFRDSLGLEVARVDAGDFFLRSLSGIQSPREKEVAASRLMTQMLVRQLDYNPEILTIVTGTNFNDTFFGFAPADPEKASLLNGAVICEPLCELFKEEVRRLASALGMPDEIVARQPFPSSGLALRIMSGITGEKLRMLREADACFSDEIRAGGYDRRLWQYYATLVENPDDPRGYAVCLRATQAAQGGAYAARIPYDVLERTAARIRATLPQIVRVVYDLTPSAHYGELE